MNKGRWVINLAARILNGEISFGEGLAFGFSRIKKKPVSLSINGLKFNEVDHILWSILADVYLNRVYLPPKFDIHPSGVVVDIGAHRGGFVSYAAQCTSNVVVAVEPDPVNFSCLERLVRKNNLRNVVLVNAAVGSRSGRSKFYRSTANSRHSLAQNEIPLNETMDEIEVVVLSLDECLAKYEVVDFLKMDTEGAEFDILMNSEEKTINKIEKLVMETHDPFESSRMKELCDHVRSHFPHVKMIDQEREPLGYLYAWKSNR